MCSYGRSYASLVQLQILREVEQSYRLLHHSADAAAAGADDSFVSAGGGGGGGGGGDGRELLQKWCWQERLDCMDPAYRHRGE